MSAETPPREPTPEQLAKWENDGIERGLRYYPVEPEGDAPDRNYGRRACFVAGYLAARLKAHEESVERHHTGGAGGWVSVKERLPEVGKWVLIFTKYWTGVGKYQPDEDFPEATWQDETLEFIEGTEITHWQPRPAAPGTQAPTQLK